MERGTGGEVSESGVFPMRFALPSLLLFASVAPAAEPDKFEVEVTTDVAYRSDKDAHKRHKLDIYVPKGKKDFPVFFFVHGGMWL